MKKRNLCIVTGSRAEYGQLYWLMKAVKGDRRLRLSLIVTGTHFAREYGETYRSILKDGFRIDAAIPAWESDDTRSAVARCVARAIPKLAAALTRIRPDIVVLLGDRYEIFAAAQTAMFLGLPIAHLHGGESTEGLVDEAIRHCMTKMAHFHFVSTEAYRRRVIQLGEQPSRVWNVGALALDGVAALSLMDRTSLERDLKFSFGKKLFLVTYHPLTLSGEPATKALDRLLTALRRFPEAQILFTKANADADGKRINAALEKFVKRNPGRTALFSSLGQRRYLSVMKHADVVIGNSSSGILEAPALRKAAVDIGERQRGRLRAPSVIHAGDSAEAVTRAIRKALSPAFQRSLRDFRSPYGAGGRAAQAIKNKLKSVPLDGVLMKRFHAIS